MIKQAHELKPGDEIRWLGKTITIEAVVVGQQIIFYTDRGYVPPVEKDARFLFIGNLADEVRRILEAGETKTPQSR